MNRALLIAAIAVSGCVTPLTPAQQQERDRKIAEWYARRDKAMQVHVTLSAETLRGCRSLGTVTTTEGMTDANMELRFAAIDRGGDSAIAAQVQTAGYQEDNPTGKLANTIDALIGVRGREPETIVVQKLVPGQILGEVYRCEAPPAVVSESESRGAPRRTSFPEIREMLSAGMLVKVDSLRHVAYVKRASWLSMPPEARKDRAEIIAEFCSASAGGPVSVQIVDDATGQQLGQVGGEVPTR